MNLVDSPIAPDDKETILDGTAIRDFEPEVIGSCQAKCALPTWIG